MLALLGLLTLAGCVSCSPLWLRPQKENPDPIIHRLKENNKNIKLHYILLIHKNFTIDIICQKRFFLW
jgi:predicted small lipoprotein YifL